MFNFKQPSSQLWQQLFDYQVEMHYLATASISDSPQARDSLLINTLEWFFSDKFDAVEGCLYVDYGGEFVCSLQHNLLAAEFLASADKVLLHGELQFQAKKILDTIAHKIRQDGIDKLLLEERYSKNSSPLEIEGALLLSHLEPIELTLFEGLINSTVEKNHYYHLVWQRSLKQAADKTSIHFKQAQILQHSILEKLQQLRPGHNSLTEQRLELPDVTKLLTVFSHVNYWYESFQYEDVLKKTYDALTSQLLVDSSMENLTEETHLEICYALVEYFHLSADEDALKCVINLLPKLENLSGFKSSLKQYQLSYVQCFYRQLINGNTMSRNTQSLSDSSDLINQLVFRKEPANIHGYSLRRQLATQFSLTERIFLEISS